MHLDRRSRVVTYNASLNNHSHLTHVVSAFSFLGQANGRVSTSGSSVPLTEDERVCHPTLLSVERFRRACWELIAHISPNCSVKGPSSRGTFRSTACRSLSNLDRLTRHRLGKMQRVVTQKAPKSQRQRCGLISSHPATTQEQKRDKPPAMQVRTAMSPSDNAPSAPASRIVPDLC